MNDLCTVHTENDENRGNRKKAQLLFILWMMQRPSAVIAMLRNLNTMELHLLKQVTSADAKNGSGGFSPISA